MARPESSATPNLGFGVDRAELSIIGDWHRTSLNRLLTLDWGIHELDGVELRVTQGGRHGPDFYPLSLWCEGYWKLDVFKGSRNGYAARLLLFQRGLALGVGEAVQWHRIYTSRLGIRWRHGQVSRLDVMADLCWPFGDFLERIDAGLYVGRMKRWPQSHPTTIYFGSRRHVLLRIYDKAMELGQVGQSLTRVEFQLGREWLRRHGVDSLQDAEVPSLWSHLTRGFRLLDRRPDGKHYDRCPTWHVWQRIQEAATSHSPAENREIVVAC